MGYGYSSPSSINTGNNCKRKYYYKYKLKLPEKRCLALIGGDVVHKAIDRKIYSPDDDIGKIFDRIWKKAEPEMLELGLSEKEIEQYQEYYRQMLVNWEKDFDPSAKISSEILLKSEKYKAVGIIDEISVKNGKIRILDNKTSKSDWLRKEHELQLGVYALLFQDNYKKLPDHVGIRFLKTGTKRYIPVNERLLAKAKYECQMSKIKGLSTSIENYPKNPSGLCKWSNGQCSYYEKCFQ